MTDDLVQRLRSNRPIPTLPHEAADRIEEMDRHLTMSGKVNKALSERIEVLEAENKWLREGVKRVENNNRELRGSKERVYAATDLRQPTQSDAVRDLVATLWCASGCSCCRDDDAWGKASHELAELLGIPKYDDGSGYDWYSVCDAAKGQSK